MIGRPGIWLWRAFGFTVTVVLLFNISVLIQIKGNCRMNELPLEIPRLEDVMKKDAGVVNKSFITVHEKEDVSRKEESLKFRTDLSKTEVKHPLHEKEDVSQKEESLKFRTDLSKIEVKHPLWMDINDMEKYVNHKDVLALGKQREKKGYLVLGVPTVYRKRAYYLVDTVRWLVNNLPLKDRDKVIIVIFVADFDVNYRSKVVSDMKDSFPSAINDGLIQVIYASREFYPNLNNLPLLYGDKANRVQWRSKQSLDYSFLYYYCAKLGEYYIQLEDDVLTESDYFTKIKTYLDSRRDHEWSTIEFGARGFIGMTYRSENLPSLAKFARFYFWTMPIDWIFRVYNDIYLHGNSKKNVFKPTIFKHIGAFSSLDGQFRKLEDIKSSGKKDTTKHIYQSKDGNPPATITTSISEHVEGHTIENAYGKEGYFWGKAINEGQYIEIVLKKPKVISRLVIPSGSPIYPSDALLDTVLLISTKPYEGRCIDLHEVARFVNAPTVDHTFQGKVEITCLRLTIEKVRLDNHNRKRWLIFTEIALL